MVADARSCPALTTAMDELSQLETPAIAVQHSSTWGQERPIGLTVKDGVSYEIVVTGQTADTASARLSIRTNAGPFASWAQRTEEALANCWTPEG